MRRSNARRRKPSTEVWTREQKRGIKEIFRIENEARESLTQISKKNKWLPKVPRQQRFLLRADPEAGAARMQGQWIALQHQLGRIRETGSNHNGTTTVPFNTDPTMVNFGGGLDPWNRPQAQFASTHVPSWTTDDEYSWELSIREESVKPRISGNENIPGHWMNSGLPWRTPVIHKLKKWHLVSSSHEKRRLEEINLNKSVNDVDPVVSVTELTLNFSRGEPTQRRCLQEESLKKILPGVAPGKGSLVYDGIYEAAVQAGEWSQETFSRLEKYRDAVLHPHQIALVLKKLGNNVKAALQIFIWARSIDGFSHDTINYSTMIRMLGHDGNWTMAEQLFKEMVEKNLPLDTFSINVMIQSYLKVNRIHNALDLYRQMSTLYKCRPNNRTFSLLIDWLGKFGSKEQLHKVYMDLMKSPEHADSNIFNTMIYNFAKVGDMLNAKEAANQMTRKGIPFSSATYGILIHMFARSQDFQAAHKAYADYLSAGLPADLTVFNNAVWFFKLDSRPEDAEAVIGHIHKAGLVPDKFTYCTIISSWAKKGGMQQAKSWFDKSVENGLTPSPEMCNALLDGFLTAKQVKPAEDLVLVSMPGLGVKPTLETFTFLLRHYSTSQVLDARILRKLMEATGHAANGYFTNIFTSLQHGQNLAATSEAFFQEARQERPRWAMSFANTLVNYLHSYGYTREAFLVFEGVLATKLYSRGIWEEMDGTWYIWLLDMEVGTALVALSKGLLLCKDKMEEGFGPDRIILMTGYIRNKSKEVTEAVDASLDVLKSPFEQNIQLGRFLCEANLFREWIKEPRVLRELDIL